MFLQGVKCMKSTKSYNTEIPVENIWCERAGVVVLQDEHR